MTGDPASAADRAAAHELLCELRTRITVQRLPYQHGVEATALQSLVDFFKLSREILRKHEGCGRVAQLCTDALNRDLRPTTARWHRLLVEGRLASRDGADAFRAELEEVQQKLGAFADQLHHIAYGVARADADTPEAISEAELAPVFAPLAFGIGPPEGAAGPPRAGDDPATLTKLDQAERAAVSARRLLRGRPERPGMDAFGLALSGGGIRSATFSLGVAQVLADRGLLGDVDFLSTVSGGGYTGAFLSSRLGAVGGEGSKSAADDAIRRSVGGPHGPDPAPVAHVRAHARYMAPRDALDAWRLGATVVASTLANWIPVAATLGAASLVAAVGAPSWPAVASTGLLLVAAASAVLGLLSWLLVAPGAREDAAKWTGRAFALAAVLAGAWLLGRGHHLHEATFGARGGAVGAALLAAGSALSPLLPRLGALVADARVRALLVRALLLLVGLVVPLGALLAFYALWSFGSAHPWLLFLGTLLLVVLSFFLDVNATSLHAPYRDGLRRTFLGDAVLPLAQLGAAAPYHLITTTVNLPASGLHQVGERRGDFFLLSPKACGSRATGYEGPPEGLDLGTAVAISGAAASPQMALCAMPSLSALMTLLNVRLGYWLPRTGTGRPGFGCLLREMSGLGMDEGAPWLNLSDGGHLENTGALELLRRRCKFLLLVDGEADGGFAFGGLLTLVRHAQVDLGIRVDLDLDELRPDPATGLCRRHATLARVHYPGEAIGLLLYLKLSVTGNESELVRRYRGSHPDFPHQGTADQSFDEEQFEAYRQLGVHVAEGLFSTALVGTTAPPDVASWFRRLAARMLDKPRQPYATAP